MLGTHFHKELIGLKGHMKAFAEAHPALAPQLCGHNADPDIERLLDAVAFQHGLLGRRLGADFPELVRNLSRLILPHYLLPVPPSTIIGFVTERNFNRTVVIPAGTGLSSVPVDGTRCRFMTCWDLEVHPMELTETAIVETPDGAVEIRLSFMLHGLTLSEWNPGEIRLFLDAERATGADLRKLICRRLKQITVSAPGIRELVLPPECLRPEGFDEEHALFPYPPRAFPGYRLFQEFYHAHEKFMFFLFTGLNRWKNRGNSREFHVSLRLDCTTSDASKVGRAKFTLNAVQAVNLFPHDAVPISLDHRASRYLVRPCGPNPSHYQVFSVDRVTGFSRSTGKERSYEAFEIYPDAQRDPAYHVCLESSPATDGYNAFLDVTFPHGADLPVGETLSIELTCTNGHLANNLRIGDIRIPEPGIPESLSFRNITMVTPGAPPPLGPELLWRLTAHLFLNHAALENAERLRTLLRLYLFDYVSSSVHANANMRRIDGIKEMDVTNCETLVEGIPVAGSHVRLKVSGDHFACSGDLDLFGCVLHRFLEEYASINGYVRLTIDETTRGESYQWPGRLEQTPS